MPFDSSLILRDGTVEVDEAEDAVPVIVLTADIHGSKVLDIRKTGVMGLVATMICPTAPTTGYADTLTVHIQEADYYDDTDAFGTVATFPILYTFVRKMIGTVTTPFASDDLGQIFTASGTGTDTGVLVAFDPGMDTVGFTGAMYAYMDDAGDTYAEVGDTLTSGGGGIATMTVAGAVDPMLSYGIFEVRFMSQKRYIRAQITASDTCEWGLISIFLSNAGYGTP